MSQPELTRDQIDALHFLERSIGPEFDLGKGTVVMEFDGFRALVRADGGIAPIPS